MMESILSVNGAWGKWTDYSKCSKSCGEGKHSRSRLCDSPKPAHGGISCSGPAIEEASCNLRPCPGRYQVLVASC